jgi:hypothetical protein
VPRVAGFERLRKTEVEHLHRAVGADLDVGRLQIPVDDSLLVRRVQSLDDLSGDRQCFAHRYGARREPIGERRALHELEDERRGSGAFFDTIDGRNVGMVQRREELRFAHEARAVIGCVQPRLLQDFDGDLSFQARITPAVDLSHSTGTDRCEDLVGPEAGTGGKTRRHQEVCIVRSSRPAATS